MTTIRVLLVEDDGPTRRRLHDVLAADPEFEVVSVANLTDARASIALQPPHVLLTDLELPDGHGTSLTAQVHASHPSIEILVISVLCDERSVVAAIVAGASGYIVKDALPDDICDTVRQVLKGHSPLSAAIARYILRLVKPTVVPRQGEAEAAPGDMLGLTGREVDILWGIAKGMSYNEIGDGLGLSRKTVPNYIKSIYRKLGVNSRGEAVFEAMSRKMINL